MSSSDYLIKIEIQNIFLKLKIEKAKYLQNYSYRGYERFFFNYWPRPFLVFLIFPLAKGLTDELSGKRAPFAQTVSFPICRLIALFAGAMKFVTNPLAGSGNRPLTNPLNMAKIQFIKISILNELLSSLVW